MAASPLRSLVADAVARIDVLPRSESIRQSLREVKVRAGVDHPCAALDEIVCTAADRGNPDALAQCLGIPYALMAGIRRVFGVVGHIDFHEASLRETKAEGRMNVFQVQDITRMTDDEIERHIPIAIEQIEADQAILLAMELELHARAKAREVAVGRLGMLRDGRRSA